MTLRAAKKAKYYWVANTCLGACDGTGVVTHYSRCCSSSYAAWRNECGCAGEEYVDDEYLCDCAQRARALPSAVKRKVTRRIARFQDE